MSAEPENEIVPAIRDWLAATSSVEVPCGLSRAEARRQASELLVAIGDGVLVPGQVDVDDTLIDVLWAATEELEEKPTGRATFEACDTVYKFVSAVSSI